MQGVGDQPKLQEGQKDYSVGSERPKSKLRDVEFSIKRLGKVMYNYKNTLHYQSLCLYNLTMI